MAKTIFAGYGVSITAEGKRHLGAAIGSPTFVKHYVSEKVDYWMSCAQTLKVIAKVQPYVAYCAFSHGPVGKWTYFLQTLPGISTFFNPLNYPSLKNLLLANVSAT